MKIKLRYDYSASELDALPLTLVRTYSPSVIIWTEAREWMTLREYIALRVTRNKEETQ